VVSDRALSAERTRILFVPEDLFDPGLAASFLQRQSLEVRSSASAAQALVDAEHFRPHLVVFRSDPEDDADFRFCHALSKPTHEPVPKLLVLTDRVTEQLLHLADPPWDGHLISPVAADQLLATIAELLAIPRRGSERVPLGVLVHAEGFSEEGADLDAALGNALTISERSMLLEASRQLDLGTRGRVQFFLPGTSERLSLDAEVRVAVDEAQLHYVLEFVDLAPQFRALLRRHVEANNP
jgi:DNA-binding response OmpR family regulator